MTFEEWYKVYFGDREPPKWFSDNVCKMAYEAGARIEREECAKLCDDLSDKDGFEGCYADACAQAIRARGEK